MSTPLPTQQQIHALADALERFGEPHLATHARDIARVFTLPQGEPVDRLAALEQKVASLSLMIGEIQSFSFRLDQLERNQTTETRGTGGGMDPAPVERVTFPPPAVETYTGETSADPPQCVEDLGFGQVIVRRT